MTVSEVFPTGNSFASHLTCIYVSHKQPLRSGISTEKRTDLPKRIRPSPRGASTRRFQPYFITSYFIASPSIPSRTPLLAQLRSVDFRTPPHTNRHGTPALALYASGPKISHRYCSSQLPAWDHLPIGCQRTGGRGLGALGRTREGTDDVRLVRKPPAETHQVSCRRAIKGQQEAR